MNKRRRHSLVAGVRSLRIRAAGREEAKEGEAGCSSLPFSVNASWVSRALWQVSCVLPEAKRAVRFRVFSFFFGFLGSGSVLFSSGSCFLVDMGRLDPRLGRPFEENALIWQPISSLAGTLVVYWSRLRFAKWGSWSMVMMLCSGSGKHLLLMFLHVTVLFGDKCFGVGDFTFRGEI